jgi:hypothetical protein
MTTVQEYLSDRDSATTHNRFMLSEMKYESGAVIYNDEKYLLTENASEQLCDLLGVPKAYADRCPEELKATTLNYWLNLRGEMMWAGLFEENKLRSLMSPSYAYVPSLQIFDAVQECLPEEMEVANWNINGDVLEYVGFSPQYDTHIVDSPVRAGLRVLYSDAWSVFPKFDSYLCRIACFNSAITPISSKKFRVSGKSSGELVEQSREYVREAITQIQPMLDGFAHLAEVEVTNFISLIGKICAENGLPKKLRTLIIESVDNQQFKATVSGEMRTMYDVINLLTWVASHANVTDAHREHLFAIAGSAMVHNTTRCDSCGGAVE